jgi:hypothetical protein
MARGNYREMLFFMELRFLEEKNLVMCRQARQEMLRALIDKVPTQV